MNRDPIHKQVAEMSTLQFDTQLNDYLSLTAKYSYATRDYQHMNDNDYSVSVSHSQDLFLHYQFQCLGLVVLVIQAVLIFVKQLIQIELMNLLLL